nr:hypothetical protein [Tanacetum cinerariifolium]
MELPLYNTLEPYANMNEYCLLFLLLMRGLCIANILKLPFNTFSMECSNPSIITGRTAAKMAKTCFAAFAGFKMTKKSLLMGAKSLKLGKKV